MGVKNLFKITIHNPQSTENGKTIAELGRETTLAKLKGKRVCVDASGMIYQAILAMKRINSLTDSKGRTTAHINTIKNKVLMIKKAGIEQIWIFDSPAPNPIKEAELKKRRERAFASKDPKVQFRMSGEHVNDIKQLLEMMGIAWIQAPDGLEAEQYGAWMTTGDQPFCDYMLSADSDVLAFGGNLLRPVSKKSATGKSSRTVYHIYEQDTLLEDTGLSRDDFLKMCVFMGTDFNPKPRGPSTKTIMSKVDTLDPTPELEAVIKYFKERTQYDVSTLLTKFSKPNKTGLLKFLKDRGFNEERIKKEIATLTSV